jgi:SAM-dependent methyltransferase
MSDRRTPLVPIVRLWQLALMLATQSARKDLAATWDLLVHPIDFIRCPEYSSVFHQISLPPGSRICDVSSPKLPSAHLAQTHTVVAGDLYADDVSLWRQRVNGWHRRPKLVVFDGRRLPFPDNAFDLTYSISVLEHVEGEGDRDAMAEIVRVTRPGGYVGINMPYDLRRRERFVQHDSYGKPYTGAPIFFSRTYDAALLKERLLHPDVDWEPPVYVYERRYVARLLYAIPRPARWGLTATAPVWANLIYGTTRSLRATQRTTRRLMEISLVGRKRATAA